MVSTLFVAAHVWPDVTSADLWLALGSMSIGNFPHSPCMGPVIVQLMKLLAGGLPEQEFTKLFVKCCCGLIITRRAFKFEVHVCNV
jgi:hypothetical protein